jgi:hypothetical protein
MAFVVAAIGILLHQEFYRVCEQFVANSRGLSYIAYSALQGHAVASLVEALCYKPEGRGLDARCGKR